MTLIWTGSSSAYAADALPLSFGLRLQGWYVAEERGAADGGTAQDFLLRRGYLSATGKLSSSVSAFVHVSGDRIGQTGLDAPGLGLGTGLALRDAWVSWQPNAAFHVEAGRTYVPFTRAFGTESTVTLLRVDLPQTQGGGRGTLFYPSKVGWGSDAARRLRAILCDSATHANRANATSPRHGPARHGLPAAGRHRTRCHRRRGVRLDQPRRSFRILD